MPLVVWAYPQGAAIEAKGGKDSFYAVDYAARTASELGADVVKVNFPHPEKTSAVKPPYEQPFTAQQAIDAVVRSANRTLVLVSGGEKAGDEAMLDKARQDPRGPCRVAMLRYPAKSTRLADQIPNFGHRLWRSHRVSDATGRRPDQGTGR